MWQTIHQCQTLTCIYVQELPKQPKQADHQLSDNTGNRGGEVSTSSADQTPLEPIGNEHTAKWKVYTTMARRLAEQVRSVTPARKLNVTAVMGESVT